MADIIDIDYLASSSAHTYKVYKPSRKSKSSKKVKTLPQLYGDAAYEQYINKLNETYSKNEEKVFVDLARQLEDYVKQVNDLYTSGTVAAFRYTQCAIVSMSININGLTCLYEMLFKRIETYTSIGLVVNSDRVKSVSDFVKFLQENLTQYLALDDGEVPYCYYSAIANFYHNNFDMKLPLVVVFEDFDCFNANLLTDLMLLIHENLEKMPLLLICCQSTDTLPLNMRLPTKATNNLAVTNFSSRATSNFFNKLISDICWDTDSSFKLGPKTISHITDVYKLWDTSLSGAFRRVKLCVFEHFFNKKYAKLCCPTNELDDAISTLTNDELISIRNLPSLQGLTLPKDEKTLKLELRNELCAFSDYLHGIQHELRTYHHLKELLFPGETFTFLMSTWITFLNSERLSETEDFFFLCEKFYTLGKYQIVELMDKLDKTEESKYSDIFKALKIHFKDFANKTQEESIVSDLKENKNHDPQKRTRASHGISSPRKTMPSMSRFELKNSLQQKAKKIPKLKKWQDDFLDILKKELDKINNPMFKPYHEIFFFDDIDLVKQFSLPATRQDILSTLQSPEKILKCKCSFGPNSPDIAIIYAIYCDNLRVANLKKCYDIFKAMIEQAEQTTTRVSPRKRAKKEPQKLNEKQALSRFINSIGDLEYLGLLRAHPRKIDHIERLVWPLSSHSNADLDSDEQMSQMSQNLNAITI